MYNKILCPIDGSEPSDAGMQEAISLAKNQHAKLRFFHVIDTYVPVIDVGGGLPIVDMIDILKKNAEEVIKKANMAAKESGVHVETAIAEALGGRPSEIVKAANEWSAELVVMGTHGLRGFERAVIGSDAENVVRLSQIPVMLVKRLNKDSKA
jgi:nucleotide-binding universal stress UspA family protein